MSITYKFIKRNIQITQDIEGYSNVICKIFWSFEFTNGEASSEGSGVTLLDTSDLTSFTDIEDVTDAQLEAWVKSISFPTSWDNYKAFHAQRLHNLSTGYSTETYFDDGTGATLMDSSICDIERREQLLEQLRSNLITLGVIKDA